MKLSIIIPVYNERLYVRRCLDSIKVAEADLHDVEIIVIDDDGEHIYNIEVNNPARVGPWRIYQVGYDTERGRWSTTSVLECVKDGWFPLIQIALWLILASGVAMALTAGRSRRKKEVAS